MCDHHIIDIIYDASVILCNISLKKNQQFIIQNIVVAHNYYNITTYIERKGKEKRKKSEKKRKINRQCYLALSKKIIIKLLSSNSFIKGKSF